MSLIQTHLGPTAMKKAVTDTENFCVHRLVAKL